MHPFERETVIWFTNSTRNAEIETLNRGWMTRMRKLEKRGAKLIENKEYDGKVVGARYSFPKSWVKITPPRKVSEAQRRDLSKRMKQMHQDGLFEG